MSLGGLGGDSDAESQGGIGGAQMPGSFEEKNSYLLDERKGDFDA